MIEMILALLEILTPTIHVEEKHLVSGRPGANDGGSR
jgi:hypothetical protein